MKIKIKSKIKNKIKKIAYIFQGICICACISQTVCASVDITKLDISKMQEKVEQGELTYEEITKIYLARIDKYNPQYNSVISVNENAVEEAKKLDEEFKKSGRRSKIHGIPLVINDNIDFVSMPTTAGLSELKDSYPLKNAKVVDKIIGAGGIILAKTNISSLALEENNASSSYGDVHNAYNLDYTSYGSSGGSAVAVAASLAAAGIGTDTNVGTRVPASANGIVGLRPTFNLISTSGILHISKEKDTVGILSKSVEDSCILLEILNNKARKYTGKTENVDLQGVRIGIVNEFLGKNVDSDVAALNTMYIEIESLMKESIATLKNLGAKCVYIDGVYTKELDTLVNLSASKLIYTEDFNEYLKGTKGAVRNAKELKKTDMFVEDIKENTEKINENTEKNKENKEKFKKHIEKIMEDNKVDVLVYPTTKNKQLSIEESKKLSVIAPSYCIAPTAGFPSINVPIGLDADGAMYGMEILAKENEENKLYEIASMYEKNTNNYALPEIAPNIEEEEKEETVAAAAKTYTKEQPKKHKMKVYIWLVVCINLLIVTYIIYINRIKFKK